MEKVSYVDRVYKNLERRFPHQVEYLQAVREFFDAIEPIVEAHPEYEKLSILERIAGPERIIAFRIPWVDDAGHIHINHGYRVQHSSLLGPYKGGIRFDPSVTVSVMKFLAFEQTFKNSLTNLPLGGAKGGADFDPRNKTDGEIMRFCQSFMTELSKYINENDDVPAGDIGVGHREIGYMYGQYKRLKGIELGVMTGKPIAINGSQARTEATGFGIIYFTNEVLKEDGETIAGKDVIISGTGNVGYHAALKAMEMGARVVAISNITGSVYHPDGIVLETIEEINNTEDSDLSVYVDEHPDATYSTQSVWSREIKADIALPCATQNEIQTEHANQIIKNGVRYLIEGANMPSTSGAIDVYDATEDFTWAPGKAANAGGVAVSALEMSQNAMRMHWTFERVDEELQKIMSQIFQQCLQTCKKYDLGHNYAVAADIYSFLNIVDLIKIQGVV